MLNLSKSLVSGKITLEMMILVDGIIIERDVDFLSPSECPICHAHISPETVYKHLDESNKSLSDPDVVVENVYVFFLCHACKRIFVGHYVILPKSDNPHGDWKSGLVELTPHEHVDKVFSKYINNVSPRFCKIYNQANNAKNQGLDELIGPGYRKALEFLVKDYLCYKFPEDSDNIKSTDLGVCIKNKIDNQRIKVLASRSAWIGNDFTHYISKHDDLSIDDLIVFIDAIVGFIDYDLIADHAESIQ